ncbi:bifunctional metallophosphatase/5'-nucleotidase [Proteiniclasticum sp. QWL-01]|uniref:bifunctional metallophosphatase/5'-nucleotidase n=1 Tax=Proteiniclasticum sp. QWL-01 TaxID=3036945 RepID=UPI00241093E9|nr:bifunctional metallophosphatase/5'-nucleotidase [Proteiniclasticum sp. QWL-01]WFF72300.1 bifunctional metallophosphatase/5'-nucleotidase [Proteiniclasticum sp. QWL-01]
MAQLTILQINDTHSYVEPHQEVFYGSDGLSLRKAGGFARISGLVRRIREEVGHETLFFDNGDTFHGTYEAVTTEGEVMIPILRRLGLDAMTFHWDIAYGPDRLLEIGRHLPYPILAGNVFYKASDELFAKPWIIRQTGTLKVGIIGLASNIIDKTMPPKFSEGLYTTTGIDELPGYIKALKSQGADLILLLSHLGYPQDLEVLRQVPGIDLCLSGHTHNRIQDPVKVNDAWIIQSGSHGSFVGRLELTIEEKAIVGLDHELISLNESVPEDPLIKDLIADQRKPYRHLAQEVVGETRVMLHRNTGLESPMDNLLLMAIAQAAGTRLAFSNGWRYGVPVPPGPVTMEDLYRIIPVDPPVSAVSMTGLEIRDMLEENLEHTYARNSFDQMGGYLKRALGLKAYIKLENPKGQRIQELFLEGEPFDPDRIYQAAFVTQQGVPKKYGTDRHNLEISAIQAIRDLLAKAPFNDGQKEAFVVI